MRPVATYGSPVSTTGYAGSRVVSSLGTSTLSPTLSVGNFPASRVLGTPASQIAAPVTTVAPRAGLQYLPAPVTTAAAPTVITTPTIIKEPETIVSVRPISKEEMMATGILIQAGGSAPAMVDNAILETGRYVQSLENVMVGATPAPVYESHHFNSNKWVMVNPRADDIVIVTAYKSGTTWMQQIVSEILFQGQQKPASVGDMSPWVDLRVPPPEVLGQIVEGQEHRRFLKTHLPADAFLPFYSEQNKYIYVARDGRDAFMSLANHYEKGNEAWYGALDSPGLVGPPCPRYSEVGGVEAWFDRWLTEGWPTFPDEVDGWPFWSYFKNVKTWWHFATTGNLNNILFVHFNNMKADLDGEMRRIADFLEVPIDEANWASCVNQCTFEEMNKNADVVAPLNGALWEGGGKSFIYKGTNNRWVDVLRPDQVAAYQQKALAELGPDCARFMETGQI